MKFSVRSPSVRAIKEALSEKIASFPKDKDGYNQSRPYLRALNEIEDNEITYRKSRHPKPKKENG